jgi:hypothetical protein
VNVDVDPETLGGFVVPFADVGDAGEEHGEAEADDVLVEALLAAAEAQAASGSTERSRSTARCWWVPR